jgi:hypothetical protein
MDTRTFSKGEVIFREGEESSEAYRLLTGEVEISIGTRAGERPLAQLAPGVFFGEMSLIDDKPRSATATALTECSVEVFHEDNFVARVLGDAGNLHLYLSTLFDRIRSTDALLQWHLNKSAPAGQGKTTVEVALRGGSAAVPAGTAPAVHLTSSSGRGRHVDVAVTRFPFRIGRATDGHGPSPLAPNHLSIPDEKPYHVSRNHCIIERSGDRIMVHDFGSKVGTIVNGTRLGTEFDSFVAPLKPGENTLVLGSEASPHHFRVVVG